VTAAALPAVSFGLTVTVARVCFGVGRLWLLLRWKEGEGLPKQPGQSNDSAKTATTRDVERVVPTIRPKDPAARVQSGDHPGVAHHLADRIEREHAFGAVEEEQARLRFGRQAARIDNPFVVAEGAKRLSILVECEERAVSRSRPTRL
jgi:hypothetical protein